MKIFDSSGPRDLSENKSSIFLAGPTLRGDDKFKYEDWRKEALKILKDVGYEGHIYVPSPFAKSYQEQIDWEVYHLEKAMCILFWVPRDLKILPAFTTNIEFGEWLRSGKIVFGAPSNAVKVRYMIYRAQKYGVKTSRTLEETINNAIFLSEKAI